MTTVADDKNRINHIMHFVDNRSQFIAIISMPRRYELSRVPRLFTVEG